MSLTAAKRLNTSELVDMVFDNLFYALEQDAFIGMRDLVSEHHDPHGEISLKSALRVLHARCAMRPMSRTLEAGAHIPTPPKRRKVLARTFDSCHRCGRLLPKGRREICSDCGEKALAALKKIGGAS